MKLRRLNRWKAIKLKVFNGVHPVRSPLIHTAHSRGIGNGRIIVHFHLQLSHLNGA